MDGGYYAIKGFSYQMNKVILELLKSDENKAINIEQIQDIDSAEFVIQVKYRETQDYTDIKVREPILQLIEEFQKYPDKEYKLYCHFKNKTEAVEKIDIERLNLILKLIKTTAKSSKKTKEINRRIESLKNNVKISFIKKFELIFSPKFQKQSEQVIEKCIESSLAYDRKDANFSYASMVDYLTNIIIQNPEKQIKKRTCTKRELTSYLGDGRRLITDSFLRESQGKTVHFNFVKERFVKFRKNQENLLIIGDVKIDNSISLEKLTLNILEKYYQKATHDIKPLTIVFSDENIESIKKYLIENEVIFNDGYENIKFSDNLFFKPAISNRKCLSNGKATESLEDISYKLRIVSYSNFIKIEKHEIVPHMIYYFDSEVLNIFDTSSFLKIDRFDTKQISDILTF